MRAWGSSRWAKARVNVPVPAPRSAQTPDVRGIAGRINAAASWESIALSETAIGKHGLRVVAQYAAYQVNTFWPRYPSGSFDFSAGLTSLPGIVNTGHAFSSFLLGLADYAQSTVVSSPSYFRRSQQLVALRDHYEAGKSLSISLGINLERGTPRVEKYDRQSTVDLGAWNSVAGHAGALAAAGRNGYGRAFQPDSVLLEPSLSIAWNPLGDSHSVVRASYARTSPLVLLWVFGVPPSRNDDPTMTTPSLVIAGVE